MKKAKRFLAVTILLSVVAASSFSVSASSKQRSVILGGTPFGLKMFTDGVMVIGVKDGSAAKKAGIREGDIIKTADGEAVSSNEQLADVITHSGGKDLEFSLLRDKSPISASLSPQVDENGYVAGMWVRDSTAGIGTMTFFDERTMSFGALGHGICDKDTGMLLPLSKGEIMGANITGIIKSKSGSAGGLNGYIGSEPLGTIEKNNDFGVYGSCADQPKGRRIAVADDDEIKLGDAVIVTTLDNRGVDVYRVQIERLDPDSLNGRNMVLKVKDKRLIEKTGGIIQGMSGSPIVQNGKLVGAVTHVFINSPTKGYGITISNMLKNL